MSVQPRCKICTRKIAALKVDEEELDLRRAVLDCKMEEIGHKSMTRVCPKCASILLKCARTVRVNRDKQTRIGPSASTACKCLICNTTNFGRLNYLTSLSKTMRMALFKLTKRYFDLRERPSVLYFCTSCYQLVININSLLNRFYDYRLSK